MRYLHAGLRELGDECYEDHVVMGQEKGAEDGEGETLMKKKMMNR